MPIVIKSRIDWLTVTLNYDNHGGGQAILLAGSPQDGVRDGNIAYIEQTGLVRPDNPTEKSTWK